MAATILESWPEAKETFVKVMPRDYQRVLDAAAVAERDGVPVEEAIMAAAHG